MSRFPASLALFVFGLLLLPASAQDESLPRRDAARTQLEKWVETEQLLSREKASWEVEKQTLTELNQLRAEEIEQLKEFITAAGNRIEEVTEKRKAFSEEEAELKAWRRELEKSIGDLETRLLPLLVRFPPPLREKTEEALLRLEAASPGRPLQERTRDVLLVLQAFLEFQSNLTLDGDIREIDGERREVDILYLGISHAWWVDAAGRAGGMGISTRNGWEWTEQRSLAPRIRRVIDIQSRTLPPEFVHLPITPAAANP